MRERVKDVHRLEHMLEAIHTILANKELYTFEQIQTQPIIFHGFVKEVEIIGEAVYMLSKEFCELHPEVEWRAIERMRHVLVHGYYKISKSDLWETIEHDIPSLLPTIQRLYEEEQQTKP